MIKKGLSVGLSVALLLGLVACSGENIPPFASSPGNSLGASFVSSLDHGKEDAVTGEIHIFAAASLTDAVNKVSSDFTALYSGVSCIPSYAASGQLQQQIEQGAGADVFLSAAPKQMDALEEKGLLLEGSRFNLLKNEVVLIVPADSDQGLSSFADLTKEDVKKIALGTPESVPVGQYSKDIFDFMGTWDAVKPKAVFGTDVRSVLSWVESGEVDCGIVYATDAAISKKVKVVAQAPANSHDPIIYPAAILKNSKNEKAAEAYLDYLKGEKGQKILEEYGFQAP